jgi:hypothetical protein
VVIVGASPTRRSPEMLRPKIDAHRQRSGGYANPVLLAVGGIGVLVLVLVIALAARGNGTTIIKE